MRTLLTFFIGAALWDAFTTFYGTLSIFYSSYDMSFTDMITNDPRKTGAALGFSVVIMLLLFSAKAVLEKGFHIMFRILIGITFLYDGITLVISGSSIAIPYLKSQES